MRLYIVQVTQKQTLRLGVGRGRCVMATVSCLAASMRVRYLGVRHWVIRRGGVGVALTLLEGVAPLAQGICSQLLRVLYFLALDGIDGHD